jgi:hypothetical protein
VSDIIATERRRRSRALSRVVLSALIPASLLLSLAAWALASPVGASPDDDYHMASIWCGQGLRHGLCEAGDAPNERRIPAVLLDTSSCFAFHPKQSASCPLPSSHVLVNTSRGNFDGSYPPIYYAAMSVFAGPDVDSSIIRMRLANAVLFVAMIVALFLLLPRALRPSLLWPVLIAMVPLGLFLVASVNPSSWAILSATGLWLALIGFATAERRSRQVVFGVLSVVLTVMGAGARSDAALFAALAVVIAGIMTFERSRRWLLRAILPVALIALGAVFFLTSGQSGVVAPDAHPSADSTSAIAFTLATLLQLPSLWVGVLGTWGLGWLDTAMPALVWVPTIFAFSAVLFAGLRRMPPRKAIAAAVAFAAVIAIPLYVLVKDRVPVGAGVQPRYVLPLIIILTGIVVWGAVRRGTSLTRLQYVVVAVLLSVAQMVALQVNIRRYVTGIDVYSPDLDAKAEWWWNLPFGPNWVWVIGSIAFALAVSGMLLAISRSDRVHPFAAAPAMILDRTS